MTKALVKLPDPHPMVICPGCQAKVQPRTVFKTTQLVIPNHERTPQPGDTKFVTCAGSGKIVDN